MGTDTPDSDSSGPGNATADALGRTPARRWWVSRLNLDNLRLWMVGLAIVVGLGGGLGSILFRELLEFMSHVLTDRGSGLLNHSFLVFLIPAVGGLVAGLLIHFYAREAKGHGVPEVMNAMVTRRSVIRPRVVIVKAFASAFTLGSGGSAGSEGPIIQIGAAWGSSLGQILRFSESVTRTLLACGAAAGIAAIFNAPLGGVLFSMEILLGDWTIAAFTPVVISAVVSSAVARMSWGDHLVFKVPDYHLGSVYELGWYILLAVVVGAVAVAFVKLLYASEDFFDDTVTWIPDWVKPAIGGALVGGIGLAYPEAMGVGYETIGAALHGEILLPLMGILLLAKLATTSLSLGSGGSGGVFAPSLFFGATLGGAFGNVAAGFLPGVVSPPGAFAVVGMGAMVAATTHAPFTAMLIIMEMTGTYHLILPLMFATIFALLVAQQLETQSIYTLKLWRKGLHVHKGKDLSLLDHSPISELRYKESECVSPHTLMEDIVQSVHRNGPQDFPVIDGEGRFVGMIWFSDFREVLLHEEVQRLLTAEDMLGEQPPLLTPENSLADALLHFSTMATEAESLPVLASSENRRLVGTITRSDLMRFYEKKLALGERRERVERSRSA